VKAGSAATVAPAAAHHTLPAAEQLSTSCAAVGLPLPAQPVQGAVCTANGTLDSVVLALLLQGCCCCCSALGSCACLFQLVVTSCPPAAPVVAAEVVVAVVGEQGLCASFCCSLLTCDQVHGLHYDLTAAIAALRIVQLRQATVHKHVGLPLRQQRVLVTLHRVKLTSQLQST
jgi:hypothetical protein